MVKLESADDLRRKLFFPVLVVQNNVFALLAGQ